jgi:hypothetical protein
LIEGAFTSHLVATTPLLLLHLKLRVKDSEYKGEFPMSQLAVGDVDDSSPWTPIPVTYLIAETSLHKKRDFLQALPIHDNTTLFQHLNNCKSNSQWSKLNQKTT